jgi:hypothetical protein
MHCTARRDAGRYRVATTVKARMLIAVRSPAAAFFVVKCVLVFSEDIEHMSYRTHVR